MSNDTKIQKMLSKANIKQRDMLLFLALRFIHDNGMENLFLEYLDKAKMEMKP